MKSSYRALLSIVFIAFILFVTYFSMMPRWLSNNESLAEFSPQRAMEHIRSIARKPHYVGSAEHDAVASYLLGELQKLGLQPAIQQGTTFTDEGILVNSSNILARIKGSGGGKALLLLSHYDSAPHSASHGASDDASGVATILEGIRAFLHNKTAHNNDIIILFSDAEELDLNGAALFVQQHQWAKETGLALNFEARGTGGPSYMLMEVNRGNAAMVEGFESANPKYPVSNSLMYSIYKMLPNDTDLTVFRQQGKIPGFNFAFIDGHYNYHSTQDDYAHLEEKTIAQQGAYLMPLLQYFSNSNLSSLDAQEDFVYFTTPVGFVNYPFNWVLPMWIGALLLFFLLVFIGIGKRILLPREIVKGFVPLILALAISAAAAFFGWRLLLEIYPQYKDLINGFTYNGHAYIAAFSFLSLAICFLCYARPKTESHTLNQFISVLFVWICLNFAIVFSLPGAGFFIIPLFASLLMLGYFVVTQRTNRLVNLLLSVPSLVILVPFIVMFPIGLGLKILFGSAVLTALVFVLLLPVFGTFAKKYLWAAVFFGAAVISLAIAHFNSGYTAGKAKPDSLVYVLDKPQNKAIWATYDANLDDWTRSVLGQNPHAASQLHTLASKYNSKFTYFAPAPPKKLAAPTVEFLRDSLSQTQRYLKIRISPNRKVNRYDVFADRKMVLHNLRANKIKASGAKGSQYQMSSLRILSYYVVNNEPLVFEFSIAKSSPLNLELMESSFDLLENPLFTISKRPAAMMPTPFVLNDAVIIRMPIKPMQVAAAPKLSAVENNKTNVVQDTLKAQ